MEDKRPGTIWCRALSARSRSRPPQQAIIALGNAVKQQALVMGFSDAFAVVGVVLVIAGIAILLTGKPKGGAAAGGGH